MGDKMTLREVLSELQEGAPVKLGLKSGYYFCGPLPENWESMIEEEHRRDMRYFCKELDSCENDIITFTGRWNDRLINAIEETQKQPGTPGAIEADVAEAIRTNHQARLQAWDSLLRRIANITMELHSPSYLDRPVTSIYDSIDPDEPPKTICILVDGIMTGKYYSSKEYKEGRDQRMEDEKLTMLLRDCGERPEVFNRISNILYENFGNLGSVIALVVTWVVIKYYDEKPEV